MKSHFTAIRASIFAAVFALCGAVRSDAVVDWYRLKMTVSVPRVYDNTQSLGYRKYQKQKIRGYMAVSYDTANESARPTISVCGLENLTHKINGERILYDCTVDDGSHVFPRLNFIGNNYTGEFRVPSVVFHLNAEPSYNVGEDDEDNSLVVTMAGHGKSFKRTYSGVRCVIPRKFKGTVSGTLGCGCRAYGHTSPTRVACAVGASRHVDDVAPVHGTWTAMFVTRNGNVVWYR